MQAKETKLQDIMEGTKQYIIPLFQRTYSWTSKEWESLWKDLVDLCETENPRTHFIGSIVSMPTVSVPEGVAKYLLIDGQQRLTTIFIILALLRNKARTLENIEFANEINDTLLVNPYKKDNDHFKLMPTQVDRDVYFSLLQGKNFDLESKIAKAYDFFEKKVRQTKLSHEKIKQIITGYFSVVSIVLDSDDNPYLVFESLNAKGRALTQSDLIRNYFFMRIHVDQQKSIYDDYWLPMQEYLKDNLTEFIRHYLMKDGALIKQTDVYYALKEKVSPKNAIEYLKELHRYSIHYRCLVNPVFESDTIIQKYLKRLNRIEVTTAYPLLLSFYDSFKKGSFSRDDFVESLKILENFLIRRFICGIPTNQLNKVFPKIYSTLKSKFPNDFVTGLKDLLKDNNYPGDKEFLSRFKDGRLYGAGDRLVKTKLILETIEENYAHKEIVPFDKLTIEHVMPQTLSVWWQNHLGAGWENTHELDLHTIGNLTLTAYNSQLSNDDFPSKKLIYSNSHLELNKYFNSITSWNEAEINQRSDILAEKAIKIWPYFGLMDEPIIIEANEVTGKRPDKLFILGQQFMVESWRDVLEQTLNTIAALESEKFDIIAVTYPRYVGKDKNKFRAVRMLKNGYFVEVNLSAQSIQKFCHQALDVIDLTFDEWKVIL